MARFLALDWDQNQLHIVQAEVRGTSVRVQRASLWQQDGTPNPAQAEDLGKKLRDRLREAGFAAAPVLACVSRDRLIVKEIRIPPVPESEEPAVVRFQAVKELTDTPDDIVLDYMINMLPSTSLSGDRKAIALVIRKELLDAYQAICQAAGLKLAALTPRVIGVSSCLRQVMGTTVLTPAPEPADGTVAVVVAGDRSAEICVFRGPTFLLARSIPVTANLAGEVRRNLAVHAGQAPQHPVRAIYVTGKGSGELRERLSELTEVPVHTFDPFAGSELPELPAGQRGTFAGAVGLLHARAAGELPINFVSPRQPRVAKDPNYARFRLALVASIALVVGLLVLGRVVYASVNQERLAAEAHLKDIEKDLLKIKTDADLLREIDGWQSPVWLDELYELTALNPDVNAVRFISLKAEPPTTIKLPTSVKAKTKAKSTTRDEIVSRVTIKGKLLGRNPKQVFEHFQNKLKQEKKHYTLERVNYDKNDEFTLVVQVERRAPTDYRHVIKVEAPPAGKKKDKRRGRDAGDE